MNKLFQFAGTAVAPNGKLGFKAAVDATRAKVLEKDGFTGIILLALPTPMTKVDAAKWALTQPDFTDGQISVINSYVDNQEGTAPKAKKEKKDVAVMTLTFEEALAQIPMRDKGRFIKKEVREQMARDLLASQG
jgi:hypothetical protein